MEKEKTLASEVASAAYDISDKPFDFVESDTLTALICESDPSLRETISNAMKTLGYRLTEATSAKEALKNMRYHVYNVAIVNENFDASDMESNTVLDYLVNLNMSTRRNIFVALVSSQLRTADNMAALYKSVNLIINKANIGDLGHIMKLGVAEDDTFYHIFKDTLRKRGRL